MCGKDLLRATNWPHLSLSLSVFAHFGLVGSKIIKFTKKRWASHNREPSFWNVPHSHTHTHLHKPTELILSVVLFSIFLIFSGHCRLTENVTSEPYEWVLPEGSLKIIALERYVAVERLLYVQWATTYTLRNRATLHLRSAFPSNRMRAHAITNQINGDYKN